MAKSAPAPWDEGAVTHGAPYPECAVDAATAVDAGTDSADLDAAPSCRELVDGGGVDEVARDWDAGTGDGGETWYDLEPCPPPEWDEACTMDDSKYLSHADHCSVFHGTVGDTACVRTGMAVLGPASIPPPATELVGDCVALRETADGVKVDPDCGEDCAYWAHHLYELVEVGECILQIEAHIHFRVTGSPDG
jgi:hypothetical protein